MRMITRTLMRRAHSSAEEPSYKKDEQIRVLESPMYCVSHALAGSNFRGHPRHCRIMSGRMPITRVDEETRMKKLVCFAFLTFFPKS